MAPASIRNNLAGLRLRERLLSLVWGAACWIAVGLVLLVFACLVDWLIDHDRDTPIGVRLGLFSIQGVVALSGLALFIAWPQIRRLSDATLALWVEDQIPEFDHRLITAVQLNEPDADLGGVSRELVAVVTREAEKQANRISFAQVANHARLVWSALVLVPVLIIAAAPVLIWPGLCWALFQRQLLLNVDIPHSVTIEAVSPEVTPMHETIAIRFRVKGEYTEKMVGKVWVVAEGGKSANYPLTHIRDDDDGAIFGLDIDAQKIPATATFLHYSARMSDGRTRYPSKMELVPRPEVVSTESWVILPSFCDARPIKDKDKVRYEQQQAGGDVTGIPGSRARIRIGTHQPIARAWLEFLAPEQPMEKKADDDEDQTPLVEKVVGRPLAMQVAGDGMSAEARFDLKQGITGYRVIIEDEHVVGENVYRFKNETPKRRSLKVIDEPPPQITLLRVTFGLKESFDLEGMPVIIGENIRVPYFCESKYGLGKAQLLYRVIKKQESGEAPADEEPWIRLPLSEVLPDASAGYFDVQRGVFQNTPFDRAVPFYAIPSAQPELRMGRTSGGGRAFLKTDGLIDAAGKRRQLKVNDQIEYCLEVYAGDRAAGPTPFIRSEIRVTTVVDEKGWWAWYRSVDDEDQRVLKLKKQQESVFGGK